MYHHQANGSRARSSRIRSSHDDEATRLDSMRRRGSAIDGRRGSRIALLVSWLGRAIARHDGELAEDIPGDPLVQAGAGDWAP